MIDIWKYFISVFYLNIAVYFCLLINKYKYIELCIVIHATREWCPPVNNNVFTFYIVTLHNPNKFWHVAIVILFLKTKRCQKNTKTVISIFIYIFVKQSIVLFFTFTLFSLIWNSGYSSFFLPSIFKIILIKGFYFMYTMLIMFSRTPLIKCLLSG